jgi:tRNA-splicing ligase RtcB
LWCLEKGFARKEDLERIEEGGRMREADSATVSERAMERGIGQVGSLGSGNHYLEVQRVDKIFDPELAQEFNIFEEGQVTVMIHCGSRGLGHQVATDYLRIFSQVMSKYGLSVPDRQLACAPFKSKEGQDYFSAMACAVNMAFANRQMLTDQVRNCFGEFFGQSPERLGMHLVYDVAHNIAKVEEYEGRELVVHRKGATRALGPGNPKLPPIYQKTGQPVIIGGSMETRSYLLVGTKKAEEETFGSTCHGSGRTMSRSQAKKQVLGKNLQEKMREEGIYVKSSSFAGLAEEAGVAYKNIDEVIDAVSLSGISQPVASFSPIGNIKG